MAYVFDWDNKSSRALAFLKGAPLSLVIAYTLYADDFGNTWASSKPDKSGALNKATGLSHGTIVGRGGARKLLIDHGLIEPLGRNVIKRIYADRSPDRRPPANSDVYHITGIIKQCDEPECTCTKILQVPPGGLYIFLTSTKIVHEVNSNAGKDLEVNTSSGNDDRPNIFVIYEQAFGYSPKFMDIAILEAIEEEYSMEWIERAFKEAVRNNVRKLSYVEAVLQRCKDEGRVPGQPSGNGNQRTPLPDFSKGRNRV